MQKYQNTCHSVKITLNSYEVSLSLSYTNDSYEDK